MPPPPQSFIEWVHERALAAGFDVDNPKGGRTALATASGMSVTQVGRTLEGRTVPDIRSQRGLAKALKVPLREMMIRSGLVEPEDLPEAPTASGEPPTSYEIEQRLLPIWASDLGITESRYTEWLRVVKAISREYARGSGQRSA